MLICIHVSLLLLYTYSKTIESGQFTLIIDSTFVGNWWNFSSWSIMLSSQLAGSNDTTKLVYKGDMLASEGFGFEIY